MTSRLRARPCRHSSISKRRSLESWISCLVHLTMVERTESAERHEVVI
jgi:hypothetical protein